MIMEQNKANLLLCLELLQDFLGGDKFNIHVSLSTYYLELQWIQLKVNIYS